MPVKDSGKMKCPECGVDMNHHAEKVIVPATPEERSRMDAALGGVVEEVHTCPECGGAASRPAA